MPPGSLTICAEPSSVREALLDRLPLALTDGDADIAVSRGRPGAGAAHVIVTGGLDDDVDAWDADVAPQTIAGVLWLAPGQVNAAEAACAWLVLRLQMPTTPLSDLTDDNGRSLRWSVAAGQTVLFPDAQSITVDPEEVRAWVDAQPAVIDLGTAVARAGGETADAVLGSVQRLHAALEGLVPLGAGTSGTPTLDAAVGEHLRQVQRSGFARWRGAKARAASLAGLQHAAREVAAQRLVEVLTTRENAARAQAEANLGQGREQAVRQAVVAAVTELELATQPDFGKVPRSWSVGAPQPRRYVFVHEDHLAELAGLDVPVRGADLPSGQALCALVQSGFSLPALR